MDCGNHALQHRVEELARLLGVAVGQQLHRAFEVGEQHRHLLALPFQGGFGGENLLGEIGRGIGSWGTRPVYGRGRSLCRGRTGCSGPDQATAVVLDHMGVGVQEFRLEVLEGVIVHVELPFERAIGHAASPLEHRKHGIENLLEGHRRLSTALALGPRQGKVRHAWVYQESAPRVYQQDGSVAGKIAPRGRSRGLGA